MKKILTSIAVASAVFSGTANAWGDREQGVLQGIAGTLIFQHIMREQSRASQPEPQPPQVIVHPQRNDYDDHAYRVNKPPILVRREYRGNFLYEEYLIWNRTCGCYIREPRVVGVIQ